MAGNCTISFFKLLRESLFGYDAGGISLTETEWWELFATCRRQACQAVVYDAAERYGMPPSLREKWSSEVKRIEYNNARIAAVVKAQRAAWERRGITAVELKGQTAAALYPRPEHRVCGDIDWWFPTPEDWRKSLDAVRENNCQTTTDSDGDIHYKVSKVIIEHHQNGLIENSPEGTAAFLCWHIAKHAMVFGVGMRQVCDYALFIQKNRESIDENRIISLCNDMGLSRFLPILNRVVEIIFSHDGAGVSDNPDDRMARRFIKLVMTDGNFGHDRKHMAAGFFMRLGFFLRCAPGAFFGRWGSLISGRLKRCFTK